jgi:hypothetical protein
MRIVIIALILIFIVALFIGVYSVQQRVSLEGQAGKNCPPVTFPFKESCPNNQSYQLSENGECVSIECK